MTITGQDLRVAAHTAAVGWRELVAQSRPTSWVWTALPFFAGAFDAERGLSVDLVLGTIYFLGPFNLLRHGIRDAVDDRGRPTAAGLPVALAIAITNVPLLLALAYVGGPAATVALIIVVGLALVDGLPVLRRTRHGRSWNPSSQRA